MKTRPTYDVTVIGDGGFGTWTAYHVRRSGKAVALLDAYGSANSRASAGESRVIRKGYGADAIHTGWSMRSLALSQEFCRSVDGLLLHRTGVLWMAREDDRYAAHSARTLYHLGIPFETLSQADLEQCYPQIALGSGTWGMLEPDSGVLMARRAVQRVVQATLKSGADYVPEAVAPLTGSPSGRGWRL